MKLRITNVMTAPLWLLIIAVWLPTFWTLAQFPGTWDGDKSSALLRYVYFELDAVDYDIHDPNKSRDCDPNPKSGGKYSKLFDDDFVWPPLKPCGKPLNKTPSTGIGDRFIPFVVLTLLVFGGQYMLTGRLTLRFTKEKEDTQT